MFRQTSGFGTVALLLALSLVTPLTAQTTTGTILGIVKDAQQATIPGAAVVVRNVETNVARSATTDTNGRFRIPNLPVGSYDVTFSRTGFATLVRSGITLELNQDAVLDVELELASVTDTVTVHANAPLLNTTNAEVGVRFDRRRVADLPVINSRDVFSLALSAPGVSQLSPNQSSAANGVNFSANGMRVRSNSFMIDGQDSNDTSVTGRAQPINNTEIVQEVRLLTNQFSAEYGRAAGSVMNVITKSGTNSVHGSAFWYRNQDTWNTRSNLDKAAGFDSAPYRNENQFGGTLGGPVIRDRTFFFGSYQRWTDRRLGSGQTLDGAPTEAGRQVLQQAAGHLPQIQALLKHLPAAQTAIGRDARFTIGGESYTVPLGSLTGSTDQILNNHQYSARIDHHFKPTQTFSARYLSNDQSSSGINSQVTPPGLASVNRGQQDALNTWLTSIFSNRIVSELRVAMQRQSGASNALDATAMEIPSIEISELGLVGFSGGPRRTAIGLAVTIPQSGNVSTYQIQETFSYAAADHALKAGVDLRRIKTESRALLNSRGRLAYSTLQRYVDDVAQDAAIVKLLPGGSDVTSYGWNDLYVFAQDEWRARSNLTVTLGLRYELPGNAIDSLVKLNRSIVYAAGGDERFALTPVPRTDTNNIQPRLGFNWNARSQLVVRGGYARTHDYQFLNLANNIAGSFPFTAAISLPPTTESSVTGIVNAFNRLRAATVTGNPLLFTRTVVADDYRAPVADQFSVEVQRQLSDNFVVRAGYVGTRGTALIQSLEGNPRRPFSTEREDSTRGMIRLRANTGSSIYHSLQVTGEKRLSGGHSGAVHYTWSSFMDDGSDAFNPSTGDVATPQDPWDPKKDWSRSSYDRPHRLAGNFVYEMPSLTSTNRLARTILGGWQISAAFTLQSGPPFTVFNGADPTGQHAGSAVGNPIRPNINTDLNLSSMTIQDILAAGGAALFRPLCGNPSPTCAGERVGNVGRNTLRADGLAYLDLALIKNTRIGNGRTLQFRVEMFNATNSRNFGIPNSAINSANFLNEEGTDGGNRRIWLSARYSF